MRSEPEIFPWRCEETACYSLWSWGSRKPPHVHLSSESARSGPLAPYKMHHSPQCGLAGSPEGASDGVVRRTPVFLYASISHEFLLQYLVIMWSAWRGETSRVLCQQNTGVQISQLSGFSGADWAGQQTEILIKGDKEQGTVKAGTTLCSAWIRSNRRNLKKELTPEVLSLQIGKLKL